MNLRIHTRSERKELESMIDNDYKSSYVVTGHQERKKKQWGFDLRA